jgi:hypothetical protein
MRHLRFSLDDFALIAVSGLVTFAVAILLWLIFLPEPTAIFVVTYIGPYLWPVLKWTFVGVLVVLVVEMWKSVLG